MSTTVNETCACGAKFEFRGDYGMTAAAAFRKAHADCRLAAAEASCGDCGCAERLRADRYPNKATQRKRPEWNDPNGGRTIPDGFVEAFQKVSDETRNFLDQEATDG